MKMNKTKLLVVVALAAIPASATAATSIVDVDFSSAVNGGLENLVDYSSGTNPVVNATVGVSGGAGLNNTADGMVALDTSRSIDSEISFSMMGKFAATARDTNAGLLFGWTRASEAFNAFNGGGTGITNADHVTVGLARVSNALAGNNNTYALSASTGVLGAHAAGGNFSAIPPTVTLTVGNWYQLSGTVLFDSGTGTFTFNDIGLDDMGATGASLVTADILTGTGKTVATTFDGTTTGRTIFVTNSQRGFLYTDNYLVTVPEPSAAILGGLGMLALLRRRR